MHDASKVKMGSTNSSYREGATSYAVSDVTEFPAGTVCRINSSGDLSTVKGDGQIIGVSLGIDLSDSDRIVVLKAGLGVPVLLTDEFEPTIGDYVWVDDATGLANVEDDGDVTTTITRGIYVSQVLTGMAEDGSEVQVALIDFVGGL